VTASPRASTALHRCALLLAGATLGLIFVGGLVTSTGSGLAVPDWPLSFGGLFPPMVGGIFYEHGHRLVATAVGLLTLTLALWVWRADRRPLVRRLALAAVLTVIAQGLLGGLTVLLLLPLPISVAHACLAQAFLCLTVALAAATSPAWEAPPDAPLDEPTSLPLLAAATAAAVYVQLILGAVMRHGGAGLAIPDFPLAFGRLIPPFDAPGVAIHFTHRAGALVVALLVGWTAATALARHRRVAELVRPALAATALVAMQIALGALTIWTRKAVLPATAHVAVGAALLATTFLLALRARRLAPLAAAGTPALVTSRQVAS
jgi:cytochrome c oxidase assembly protein subunit 15